MCIAHHLAPAEGGSIDIPGKIMTHFFGETGQGRIPIIVGNNISDELFQKIYNKYKEIKEDIEFGSLRKNGISFNDSFFTNHKHHDENCKILFRNPLLDIAVLNHSRENVYDFGIWHGGLDIAILNKPNYAEDIMERDLLPGGLLFLIDDIKTAEGEPLVEILVTQDENELHRINIAPEENIDDKIFELLEPHLNELLFKYD